MCVLSWKVNKTVQTGCPDFKADPYTGQFPSIMCAVYHCKTVTEKMFKEFENETAAKDFIKNAPSDCYEFKIINGNPL